MEGRTFPGTSADRGTLGSRGATFRIRWDRAPPGYCHNQKCWIIDAGHPTELAFGGGINLNSRSMVDPGNAGAWPPHDSYAALPGPSPADGQNGRAVTRE